MSLLETLHVLPFCQSIDLFIFRKKGDCKGRCVLEGKIMSVLVLDPTTILTFDVFEIPGYCTCKNITQQYISWKQPVHFLKLLSSTLVYSILKTHFAIKTEKESSADYLLDSVCINVERKSFLPWEFADIAKSCVSRTHY